MTTLLSNIEVGEVSLVGKAANGKTKFLIYKSQERVRKMTPPASKKKATDITKAVDDAVQKAMADERRKTEAIRKELNTEKSKRRRGELTEIAKSQFGALGPIEDTVATLEAIEKSDMPRDAKKKILTDMKQANEIKKQSDLFKSFGTDRPAPGTPTAEFDSLVETEIGMIRKSADAPKDQNVLKAMAVDKVSRERPDLARAVIAEERAMVYKQTVGVI